MNGHVSFPIQRTPKTKTMTMTDDTKIDLHDVNMLWYHSAGNGFVNFITSYLAGIAATSGDYVACLCFSDLFAFDILLFLGRLFMHAPAGKKIRCVCVCRIYFITFSFMLIR